MNFDHLGLQGLSQMPNLHPIWVHLPIAFLPLAFIFFLVGVVRHQDALLTAGRWTISFAALGAAAAVWSGSRAQGALPHNEAIHALTETHETLGWTVLILSGVLALWSFWREEETPKGVYGFLAVLALTNIVLVQQGDIGGRLVYVQGAGVKPAMAQMDMSAHSAGAEESGHHEGGKTEADSHKKTSTSPTPSVSASPTSTLNSGPKEDHSSHSH